MAAPPRITVGIPVFRGEALVTEALASLQAQTFRDFKAIISVDGGDEASAAVCRRFESDPRFRIVVQPQRLDWSGNVNWLARQVDTEFFVYLAQDDRHDPTYLQSLIAVADTDPDAVIVYSDMQWFGARESIQEQPEIVGTVFERIVAQLEQPQWFPFLGLRRAEAQRRTSELIVDGSDSILEDVVWVTRMMQIGPIRRVARPLYHKRLHPGMVTMRRKWSPDRIRLAWYDAWMRLLAAALPAATTRDEIGLLLRTVIGRVALSAPDMDWFLDLSKLDRAERRHLVIQFIQFIRDKQVIDLPALLGYDWDSILRLSLREAGLEPGLLGRLRREYRRFRRRIG